MAHIQVISKTQRIVLNPATSSIGVINAGPPGPGAGTGSGGGSTGGGGGTTTFGDIDGGQSSTVYGVSPTVDAGVSDTVYGTATVINGGTASG